jgi:hypothetical protein
LDQWLYSNLWRHWLISVALGLGSKTSSLFEGDDSVNTLRGSRNRWLHDCEVGVPFEPLGKSLAANPVKEFFEPLLSGSAESIPDRVD